MPKQDFEPLDYCGPIVVGFLFLVALFFISFFIINFFCITKYDDVTKFEQFGARHNIRLGPHPLVVVRHGGFVSKEDITESD